MMLQVVGYREGHPIYRDLGPGSGIGRNALRPEMYGVAHTQINPIFGPNLPGLGELKLPEYGRLELFGDSPRPRKAKVAVALKGRPSGPEHAARMREVWRKRRLLYGPSGRRTA